MKTGLCGPTGEVPELARYGQEVTGFPISPFAYYIEILDGNGERVGVLAFYDPERKSDGVALKIGAALKNGWGNASIGDFLWIRRLFVEMAFMKFGADHLEAVVMPRNIRARRMLRSAGFALRAKERINGREALLYRLVD